MKFMNHKNHILAVPSFIRNVRRSPPKLLTVANLAIINLHIDNYIDSRSDSNNGCNIDRNSESNFDKNIGNNSIFSVCNKAW